MSRPNASPSERPGSASRDKEQRPGGREDAFDVPPIASRGTPEERDVSTEPGAEAGHYGPGYYDPTTHMGGDWPGKGASLPTADAAQASAVDAQADQPTSDTNPATSKGDDARRPQGGAQQ